MLNFIFNNFFLIIKLLIISGIFLCTFSQKTKINNNGRQSARRRCNFLFGAGIILIVIGILLLILSIIIIIILIYGITHLKSFFDTLQ